MASLHRWRVEPGGRLDLASEVTRSVEGAPGGKNKTADASAQLVKQLAELQTRLWAEHRRSMLVVLQAMDAGGKDGTIRKVFSGVNPQGVTVTSFKAPTEAELAHDFLWRVHAHTPGHGEIAVFNRSHYEDVLVARVDKLVPVRVWRARYETIRAFEQGLAQAGTTVVKLFLHISKDEQAKRFQSRLDDPTRRWKFSAADLDVRKRWADYQEAFGDAFGETSTHEAPWYAIPADHKWYRDWAVLEILVATLRELDLQFPKAEAGLDDLKVT